MPRYIALVFLIAVGSGCDQAAAPPTTPPAKVVIKRNGTVFQYPFGVFWGLGEETPVINSAEIEHTDQDCPLVWIGEEPLDFAKENEASLRKKYGDRLEALEGGKHGVDLTAVTKFICVVHFNESGEITSVFLYSRDAERPCLSRTHDSERLFLPCSQAELETCFGPPVKATPF